MDGDDYAHKYIPFTNKRTDTRRTLTGRCFSPKTYGNKALVLAQVQ